MIHRELTKYVEELLSRHPVVAILGPRQVGKTTLAFEVGKNRDSVYLDLESPFDRAKLAQPEFYFSKQEDKLFILDEIQLMPELFQILRGIVDAGRRRGHKVGQFLVLGSASLDLLRQSSETLAGRIIYTELTPLGIQEIENSNKAEDLLWVRGGFPNSYLAENDAASLEWRQAFIKTYLERDIPQFGPRIPAETLRRFWTMLSHLQGSLLNVARVAGGLGVTGITVARYLDLMVDLLLVRRLSPWESNHGKRLVKSPKVYVRDSGLVHALLKITDREELLGHPIVGASWEGYVIENLINAMPTQAEAFFYRTSAGAEIDLVILFPRGKIWAVEIKRSLMPTLGRGFHQGCLDLKPEASFVVYPGRESFQVGQNIEAISLIDMVNKLKFHISP